MKVKSQPKTTVNSVTLAQRNRAVGLTAGVAANILESNTRHIQRNMRSKHPAPSLRWLSDSWFAEFTDCLRRVLAQIEETPPGSILLRTFDKEDQLQDHLRGDWEEWNGERYNDLVQHIFLLDELGLIDRHPDTSLVAVSNSDWEGDELVDHLPPDSATFAIVYRDPNNPSIEFCRHRFASELPHSDPFIADLHVIEQLSPKEPLSETDLSRSKIWSVKSFNEFVLESGYRPIEEWTLLGRGTPIAIAAVLED